MGLCLGACHALDYLEHESRNVDPLCQSHVCLLYPRDPLRLTTSNSEGLRVRKLLNALIIWTVCAFVGDELALFLICRPLSQYWAVPPINRKHHRLTAPPVDSLKTTDRKRVL